MTEPLAKLDLSGLEKLNTSTKLQIVSPFSKEETGFENIARQIPRRRSRYKIDPHPGFEQVELPYNGETGKLAYGQIYPENRSDYAIELNQIAQWEGKFRQRTGQEKIEALNNLKFHYKRSFSLCSKKLSDGWNRFADTILDLQLSNKREKILWGSGGCSKSTILGLCKYTWWRVNPSQRLVLVVSRVKKEADRRVIAYIKEIHLEAPPDDDWKMQLIDTASDTAIHCLKPNYITAKKVTWTPLDRAGIISLPIKIEGATGELGENLMGSHPDDALDVTLDECQELPGVMKDMKIWSNWLTNPHVSFTASGNPIPVELYAPEKWDLLYRMGAQDASAEVMKAREKEAHKTTMWTGPNHVTLHLSMLDSPRDDPEEEFEFIVDRNGIKKHRLWFLAGKESAQRIIEANTDGVGSPSYFSQALGFPFLIIDKQSDLAVITPTMVSVSREYPLVWKNRMENRFVLGMDPSLGRFDPLSIVCGELGLMRDGRHGVDLHNGKFCRRINKGEYELEHNKFADAAIELLWDLSNELQLPLNLMKFELHGVGEVFRYAIQRHIEEAAKAGADHKFTKKARWANEQAAGKSYAIFNPTSGASERDIFREVGTLVPAKTIVPDIRSELWLGSRCLFSTRQVFNVPEFILEQGYRRNFIKPTSQQKMRVESKEEMLKRGVKSPNDYDAFVIMLDHCRLFGLKFVFLNRYSYKDKWGQDYVTEAEQIEVNKRLGRVSEALGLSVNLGELNGGTQRTLTRDLEKSRRSIFSFRSI